MQNDPPLAMEDWRVELQGILVSVEPLSISSGGIDQRIANHQHSRPTLPRSWCRWNGIMGFASLFMETFEKLVAPDHLINSVLYGLEDSSRKGSELSI